MTISGQISLIAQPDSSRLGFPLLITALCKARGVTFDSLTFESLSPAINLACVKKNCWNLDDPSVTFPCLCCRACIRASSWSCRACRMWSISCQWWASRSLFSRWPGQESSLLLWEGVRPPESDQAYTSWATLIWVWSSCCTGLGGCYSTRAISSAWAWAISTSARSAYSSGFIY